MMFQLDNRNLMLQMKGELLSFQLPLEVAKYVQREGNKMMTTMRRRKRKEIQIESQTLSKIQRKYEQRRNVSTKRGCQIEEDEEVVGKVEDKVVEVEVLMWLGERGVRVKIKVS